jgi:hypothetical protein
VERGKKRKEERDGWEEEEEEEEEGRATWWWLEEISFGWLAATQTRPMRAHEPVGPFPGMKNGEAEAECQRRVSRLNALATTTTQG